MTDCLFIIATSLFSYFTTNHDTQATSELALAITSSLIFLTSFQYLVAVFTDIQSSMTSVERMLSYSNLEQEEDPALLSDNRLPEDWPLQGAISKV